MTKKKRKTETKPPENGESETSEPEQLVTSVDEVIPKSPEKEPEKIEDLIVNISEMPTKNIKRNHNLTETDMKVFDWYSGLVAGDRFTRQEAADLLEIKTFSKR